MRWLTMINAEEKKTNDCDWGITFLNPKSDGSWQRKKAKRGKREEAAEESKF